jgi:hypothetical protein
MKITLALSLDVEFRQFFYKRVVDNAAFLCNIMFIMSEIREAILKHMNKSGMTIYQVGKLVEGKVPQRTIYAFLTGEKDAGTRTASIIMKALGLTVTTKPIVKRGKSPRKEVRP